MNSAPDQFRERSRTEMFFDFLQARLLSIVGLLVLGAGAAIVIGYDPSIPRWVALGGFTVLAFAPLGYITGNWLLSHLYNPMFTYVLDLDAGRTDGALHRFPPEDFRELTVTDEDGNSEAPYDITQLAPSLFVAKEVDLETLTCVGTWRGTLDDRELARSLRAVRECRGQLQDDAQKGFVLETSAFTIVRRAAREATLDVVEMFQKGTLPGGGTNVNEAVDEALQEFGFEDIETNLEDLTERSDLLDEKEQRENEDDRHQEETNGAESPEQPQQLTND